MREPDTPLLCKRRFAKLRGSIGDYDAHLKRLGSEDLAVSNGLIYRMSLPSSSQQIVEAGSPLRPSPRDSCFLSVVAEELPKSPISNEVLKPAKDVDQKGRTLKQISYIEAQRYKSLQMQRELVMAAGLRFEVPGWEYFQARVKSISEMKEDGYQMESIRLELDRRYYNMFKTVDEFISSLKVYLSRTLDEQKKEIFNSLLTEVTQNSDNFNDLESKLKEIVRFQNVKERVYSKKLLPELEAFKKLFKFSEEFSQEFFGMISSKINYINLANIKSDLNKIISSTFSTLVAAPKVFPSELHRFFLQSYTKMNIFQVLKAPTSTGMYTPALQPLPQSIMLNKYPKPFTFDFSKPPSQLGQASTDKERIFNLIQNIDKHLLVVSSKNQFKIIETKMVDEACNVSEQNSACSKNHTTDQMMTRSVYSSEDFTGVFDIQSLAVTRYEGQIYLIFGGSKAVGRVLSRISWCLDSRTPCFRLEKPPG